MHGADRDRQPRELQQRRRRRDEQGKLHGVGEPYGTFDQGGNLFEWNEAIVSGYRGIRGGQFDQLAQDLAASQPFWADPTAGFGFRVAMIPEPGTGALLSIGLLGLAYWRRHDA